MRSFKYVGDCLAGYVEFTLPTGALRMAKGEAVEVPDFMAAKFARNSHFEEVKAEKSDEPKGKKGK